jgi:hypothetical protein
MRLVRLGIPTPIEHVLEDVLSGFIEGRLPSEHTHAAQATDQADQCKAGDEGTTLGPHCRKTSRDY